MGLFSEFFSRDAARHFVPGEVERIVNAIRQAETRTSGEIRVFVESRCRYIDPLFRAAEIFFGYKMDCTHERNAVLVYVAMRDHQFAIFADEGIYREMGKDYWNAEAQKMLKAFMHESYADGIVSIIEDIGNALAENFPFDKKSDKNELPDNIIFGK